MKSGFESSLPAAIVKTVPLRGLPSSARFLLTKPRVTEAWLQLDHQRLPVAGKHVGASV